MLVYFKQGILKEKLIHGKDKINSAGINLARVEPSCFENTKIYFYIILSPNTVAQVVEVTPCDRRRPFYPAY